MKADNVRRSLNGISEHHAQLRQSNKPAWNSDASICVLCHNVHAGQEPIMLLLFWYLPLILFSGTYDAVSSQGEQAPAQVERNRGT
jgi:hypothetical protein